MLTLPAVIGTAIGFFLPGAILGSEDSSTTGKDLFLRLLLIEAIITTALSVPLFIFFRERPPSPPSASATVVRDHFWKGMKALSKNKSYLWILVAGGISLGTLNALGAVIGSLIDPFGFSQV